eukprot:TRINITY_DN3046_c0_g1_i1.p1 TRINITY_DN3046_c0_g1~~TRINITY_DN3046_c0_g1_i1.p1  ORF type:complete len:283 (+),score=62.14 TRINITY_DN3046_c0_g1_i1:29-850(+)
MALPSFSTLELQLEKVEKDGLEGSYLTIRFNRPQRKNAISIPLYNEIVEALNYAKQNPNIKAVVLTGKGDYYSSGNDLSAFTTVDPSNAEKMLKEAEEVLLRFIRAFLYFPKILIAAVNGPAIGVAATTLAHCDFVYASETASFNTPFVTLGQTPEACSSVMFPQIMGHLKANEVLLLNRKLDAKEAHRLRLVNDVFPAGELMNQVRKVAEEVSLLPPDALTAAKKLIRSPEIVKQLDKIHEQEVKTLGERWKSEEFMTTVMNFMMNKSKAKL